MTSVSDVFQDLLVTNWPQGETHLTLSVERDGKAIALPTFRPETIGLHPTQVYETISALLILLLLTAYYPFRRHDGEVFVLFMLCYSIHRFINEMLRNDTPPVFAGMTLSQNTSILVLTIAVVLLAYLWLKPKREEQEPAAGAGAGVSGPVSRDAESSKRCAVGCNASTWAAVLCSEDFASRLTSYSVSSPDPSARFPAWLDTSPTRGAPG